MLNKVNTSCSESGGMCPSDLSKLHVHGMDELGFLQHDSIRVYSNGKQFKSFTNQRQMKLKLLVYNQKIILQQEKMYHSDNDFTQPKTPFWWLKPQQFYSCINLILRQ